MFRLPFTYAFVLTALLFSTQAVAASAALPPDLQWQTNNKEPVFASPDAQPGGTFNSFISSFPLTLRTVGPDSNGSFASYMRALDMGLVQLHPNTRKLIPGIATHWAFGDDNQTMYFKIDPRAKWSDGKPVTAADFEYVLTFMRSKYIKAPWYNNYYTQQIESVTRFDDHTIAIKTTSPRSPDELFQYLALSPIPKHFYENKLDDKFVRKFNWKIPPNTGPYSIDKIEKGKSITLKKNKNWWAKDNRYFAHRFNVDKIRFQVIRDEDMALRRFEKAKLDAFPMLRPNIWHKTQGKVYDNGLVQKIWAFNNAPQGASGIWLNQDVPLLSDINVRKGIAHALNIDKMLATTLRGDYFRMNSIGDGYGDYTDTSIKAPKFDSKLAMQYFANAGFKDMGPDGFLIDERGHKLSLSLLYLTPGHTDRVTLLKEEARKAGLDLQLNLVAGANGFKTVLEKKHQAVLLSMSSGLIPQYWEYFHSTNAHKAQTNNFTNTDIAEIDNWIEQFRSTFEHKKRVELAHKIQRRIIQESAYIPTYKVPYTRSAYWRWLKLPDVPGTGLTDDLFAPLSLEYGGLFWIDSAAKKETLDALKSGKKFPVVEKIDESFRVQ